MARTYSRKDSKAQVLETHGTLHPHPETVRDELFDEHEFFDPRDRVQVKYEMLRRHRVDGKPVATVASLFGASRQGFYLAQTAFEDRGIGGLIAQRRGPKGAHKCTDELLTFAQKWRSAHPAKNDEMLVQAIQEQFGTVLNPRSVDRALLRQKKKRKIQESKP